MERTESRRRELEDTGFTLIELVVALTVLSVGIVAVVGVTNGSFRAASGASARSRMVALATKEIEALRAIPYKELEDGYVDETRTDKGITVRVERTVGQLTTGDRHREAVVSLSWRDASGVPHEVHQSTYLYPGGIGPASGTATTSTTTQSCTPSTPTNVAAAAVADLLQATTTIDVTWTASTSTCPPASYVIRYATGTSSIVTEVTRLATTTAYRVTGLTAGTQYQFQVAAKSASGQLSGWSSVATATTATTLGTTCTMGSITITPPAVNKKSNGEGSGLKESPVVNVPTQGSCAGFNAVYKPTAATTQTAPLVRGTDGAYTGSLNKDLPWDVGRRYVDIVRTSDAVKVGSVLLTVCEHNVSQCS